MACACGSNCLTQGGEVVGTEGRGSTAAARASARSATRGATRSTTVATETTTVASTTLAITTATTGRTVTAAVTSTSATVAATAATATTTGRTVLGGAGVVLPDDSLLDFLVLQLLGLGVPGGDEVLLVLLGNGSALWHVLDFTDLELVVELSSRRLLGEVSVESDLLDLGLLGLAFGFLSVGLGLLSLSDGLTGLLVLQLGLAFVGTPRLGSLLLGAAVIGCQFAASARWDWRL